jgi:transposase
VDTSDYPNYSQNCLATAGVDFDIKALAATSDSLTTGSPSQRKAALHVLLIRAYEWIMIEDFNARRRVKNCKLVRLISDAVFGIFCGLIAYKAFVRGNTVEVVDRF